MRDDLLLARPGNYCTLAIEALRKHWAKDSPQFADMRSFIESGVKFLMPDGGRLLTDKLDMVPDVVRLPFPRICIEYANYQEPSEPQPNLVAAPHRIILAEELTTEQAAAKFGDILPANKIQQWAQPFIAMTCLAKQEGKWFPGFVWALLPSERDIAFQPVGVDEFRSDMMIVSQDRRLLNLYWEVNRENLDRAISADFACEIPVLYSLVQALSCVNVTTEKIPAPEKLNKARKFKGAPPIFEYHVLCIAPKTEQSAPSAPSGIHASPRMHLRRGHIRRLPKGNIWINAMVVGSKHGMIAKDYRVVGAAP